MRSSPNPKTMSWYDTPLGRLSGGIERRRAQPSVAEVVAHLSHRPR